MKSIPLSKGQIAMIDDEDYERVSEFKWYALWNKDTQSYYAARSAGGRINKHIEYLHRFIMQTPKGMICDHRNHNTLDDRKSNLRNCTPAQSSLNTRMSTRNTTGHRCITLRRNKYRVVIKADTKTIFDRVFPTLDEAIVFRDKAIAKHHGDFAPSS